MIEQPNLICITSPNIYFCELNLSGYPSFRLDMAFHTSVAVLHFCRGALTARRRVPLKRLLWYQSVLRIGPCRGGGLSDKVKTVNETLELAGLTKDVTKDGLLIYCQKKNNIYIRMGRVARMIMYTWQLQLYMELLRYPVGHDVKLWRASVEMCCVLKICIKNTGTLIGI